MEIEIAVREAVKSAGGWSVKVALRFTNSGQRPFALDKRTLCDGGEVSNPVFDVRRAGEPLDYLGVMAKRAHPGRKGFVVVAPGASYEVGVEIGGDYRFPAEGGEFTVAFDSFNHFSKDAVQLRSAPVAFSLRP